MFNWNLFPFTKNDSVNLDWIFSTLKKLVAGQESMEESVARAEQAAADAEAAAGSIVGAVVYAEAQELTAAEQEQARENISAASASDLATTDAKADAVGAAAADTLKYTAQTLTTSQQEQARGNIGAASASDLATTDAKATAAGAAAADTLKYTAQTLTTSQQEQARDNIGAASASDLATTDAKATAAAADTLKYTAQTLTTSQQEQARDNIGAASIDDIVDNANLLKLSLHGSLTISNATGRDVIRNTLKYALNADRTIGLISGNLIIACISSDLTNQMPTGLQVPAPASAYEIPLNCVIARATSDNSAINTSTNLTRLYCNDGDNLPRLYVDLKGEVYFRFTFNYSSTVGNYYFFWISPTLMLLDPDSNP